MGFLNCFLHVLCLLHPRTAQDVGLDFPDCDIASPLNIVTQSRASMISSTDRGTQQEEIYVRIKNGKWFVPALDGGCTSHSGGNFRILQVQTAKYAQSYSLGRENKVVYILHYLQFEFPRLMLFTSHKMISGQFGCTIAVIYMN